MKVGIVTFYRVANYGAMLQAYALWKYLEGLGFEVIFIRHKRLAPPRLPLLQCLISRSLEGIRKKLKSYVRFHVTKFAESFPQTDRCKRVADIKSATADCDAFIVGSDQMWNPIWCAREYLPLVMLDFASDSQLRIAYSVSFGTKEWKNDQNAGYAGRLLSKFKAISVREQSGVELVRSLSGRCDARCLLDPTLLHTSGFYRRMGILPAKNREDCTAPYICRYILDEWDDGAHVSSVFRVLKQMLGIDDVKTDRCSAVGPLGLLCRCLHVDSRVSVSKWIARIAYSDFVVTNSFHGVVFAVLFHRPFLSLLLPDKYKGMNERLLSLLSILDLEYRAIYPDEIFKIDNILNKAIDWDGIDSTIQRERHATLKFFRESFN